MPELQPSAIVDYEHPDWTNDSLEAHCPLCDYNLRGLIDPRCPECGYQFEWRDLLDPQRKPHPYLFELYCGSRFVSFWKTAYHGLRPKEFWKTLRADQRVAPSRLIGYAVTVGFIWTAASVGFCILSGAIRIPPLPSINKVITGAPEPSRFYFPTTEIFFYLIVTLGWPIATFLSLLVFQISMRRAKVRAIHVVRCVVYAWDAVMWVALAMLLLQVAFAAELLSEVFGLTIGEFSIPDSTANAFGLAWIAATFIFGYRLTVAYRSYLRFPHAMATILASQLMVVLSMCALLACHGSF